MSESVQGRWNPGRVLHALGRIGYHPVDAVLDIADNAVSAGASRIDIDLELTQEEREGVGRRRILVSSFSIADNGSGMTRDRLEDALALGSSDEYYAEGTLSKFGMGLKSASASLGLRLVVVTRPDNGDAIAAELDIERIEAENRYVYELRDPSADEFDKLDAVTDGASGTVVRIDKVHETAMTDPARIVEDLERKAGVVYLDYLRGRDDGDPLSMRVNGQMIEAIDPLFVEEIEDGDTGKLDETSWDGQGVQWLLTPQTIQLTPDGSVTARVMMTQLPHPPSVRYHQEIAQSEVRDRYMIGAGNYGFYIYRHGRLVSWADDLDGMVARSVELYAFRGRLDIDTDADDVLNINVRKSEIQLSDIAAMQLAEHLTDAIKKSRTAWNRATNALRELTHEGPTDELNAVLETLEAKAQELARLRDTTLSDEEKEEARERRKRATEHHQATAEESEAVQARERWQWVENLEHNELWRRGHDPAHGSFVRVNRSHRLIRDVIDAVDDARLLKIFGLILYCLARGEYMTVVSSEFSNDTVESIMDEFREQASAELSESIKRLNVAEFLSLE